MLQLVDNLTPRSTFVRDRFHKQQFVFEWSYPIPQGSHPLVFREDEMELFWLDDEVWRTIAPLLPSRQSGPKRADDRTIISGIVHVLISGCAWRDSPAAYGPSMTVFNRFNRWKHRGLWARLVAILCDPEISTLSPTQRQALQAATASRATTGTSSSQSKRASDDLSAHQAWEEAADQLRKIAHANHGRPIAAWIDAVVEWHMDAMFAYVERHAAHAGAAELNAQVVSLRSDLLGTVAALRAYVDEPHRNASAVRQQLARLEMGLRQAVLADPRRVRAS